MRLGPQHGVVVHRPSGLEYLQHDILFHSLWLLSHGTRHKDKSKLNLYEGSKKPSELHSQLYTNVQDPHVVLGGTRPDGYRGHLLAPSPLLARPAALL